MHRFGLAASLALLLVLPGCAGVPRLASEGDTAEADAALRRGQRLFLQDRLAWVASDLYQEALQRSAVPAPRSVVWTVQALPEGGWMVSFVIDIEEGGGYVDAEVYFTAQADPDACLREGLADPSRCDGIDIARGVRPVRAEEARWLQARHSMLGYPALRVCSPVPPNFSLLEDAGRWFGYVLTASDDPQHSILAGHTRFELSADGRQILQHRPLYERCRALQGGDEGLPDTLLVAGDQALFHEGHVFLHLDLRRPVRVRNRAGQLTEISGAGSTLRWRLLE